MDIKKEYSECEKHPEAYWHILTYGEECPYCKLKYTKEEMERLSNSDIDNVENLKVFVEALAMTIKNPVL